MIDAEILDECDRLKEAVLAPEKLAHPIHFTDAPRADIVSPFVVAFACPGDLLLREHLISRGRWRGAGPIICFVQENPRHKLLGTALHEMVHAIEYRVFTPDRDPTAAEREQYEIDRREWIANMAKMADAVVNDTEDMPPWYPSHGPSFIRIGLHLHARSWQAGWEIGLPEMRIADFDYGMSAPWKYMHALGDEPKRMADATSAEILATDPPQEFIDLFHSDVDAWFRERSAKIIAEALALSKKEKRA